MVCQGGRGILRLCGSFSGRRCGESGRHRSCTGVPAAGHRQTASGLGVAGKLLDVFLRFAQANRLAFLTLEVRPSNAAAIALYESAGYRQVGFRKRYYHDPEEGAVLMTREVKKT